MKKDDVIKTFTLLQADENTKKIFDADISARIPYSLHCCVYNFDREVWVEDDILYNYDLGGNCQTLKILNERGACLMYYQIRPYLRPMSSMTKEERKEYESFIFTQHHEWDGHGTSTQYVETDDVERYVTWLNKKGFDYRGLISMGLALEAKEGMYKIDFPELEENGFNPVLEGKLLAVEADDISVFDTSSDSKKDE